MNDLRPLLWLPFAFLLTLLLEGAAACALTRKTAWLYPVFLCNLLTNPALNAALLLLGPYLGAAYIPVLIALELAAVAAESAVLRLFGMKYPRALLLSAAINTLSCGAGILLWQVL